MPGDAAQDAWADYRLAIDRLYQAGDQGQQDRGDAGLRVDRLDDVVASSERLKAELSAGMTAQDLAQRELTGLKLVAAAAYDLSIAADAALLEEEGPAASTDRAAASEVLTDPGLRRILDASPGAGTLAIVTVDRRARASTRSRPLASSGATSTSSLRKSPTGQPERACRRSPEWSAWLTPCCRALPC